MNSSDFYNPQLEGDQQHMMQQQQQQRYNGGGGNRGGNYRQPQQGQGGGNPPRPQHQHPNQQQQQPNQQQGQGQVGGQGQAIRPHLPQQLQQTPQYMFAPQSVPVYYQNPQASPFRYPIQAFPTQYGQTQQVYPIQQPQFYTQQQLAVYAAQAAAMQQAQGNLYYQTAAQPQNPQQHHNPPPYYAAQAPTGHTHYVRAAVPTPLPVAAQVQQQQQPPQTQQSQHPTHQGQGHPSAQQVAPGTVIPQQQIVSGLVTQASLPQPPTEVRETLQRRERKVLKITNPDTGEEVIPTKREDYDRAPSSSPQPTVESVGLPEENIRGHGGHHGGHGPVRDVEAFEEHIRHHGGHGVPHAPPPHGGHGLEVSGEEPPHVQTTDDSAKNKAKVEFFQSITAVADPRSRSNSTPDAHGGGVPSRISPPLPSSSPTPPVATMTSSTSAFEPQVAASAPAFVHSHKPSIPIPEVSQPTQVPVEKGMGAGPGKVPDEEKPCLPSEIPEGPPEPPAESSDLPPLVSPPELSDESGSIKDELSPIRPPPTEEEVESPITPPKSDGGQFLDISTVSISPDPIEKYHEVTPVKVPLVEAETNVEEQGTESGEPPLVPGNLTRESTASPTTFLPKGEPSLTSLSTPNQLTDEDEGGEDEGVQKTQTGINENEVKITAVEPAQNEPTFTNGGNEIHEGSGEEEEENNLEEGELLHDDGESDEANEPIRKRIVYDRDTLINYKSNASKDVQGIDSIPPELIRDERSTFNIGPLPPRPSSGGYSGQSQGGGYNMNRNPAGGGGRMGNNNRPFSNRPGDGGGGGGQWGIGGMGPGGMFPIPPPPPGHRRPPPMIIDTGYSSTGGRANLNKAKNPWKPGMASDETKDEEQILIDDMKKRTRGILNKLTPENFDTLVKKFLTLKFEVEVKDAENRSQADMAEAGEVTAGRIGAVISVVFEKAIDEPSFSTAYAKMVQTVYSQASNVTSKIFRKKILDQCQKEFQQGNSEEESLKKLEEKLAEAPEDKKALIKLEIEDKKTTARRRSLGNVRFIGELFKLGMLTSKIMTECVNRLLATPDEENLECLCKLLSTIGQKLENQIIEIRKNSSQSGKFVPDTKFMTTTFNKLKDLSNDKSLSSRIRFALLDVYELRDSGWIPRRDANAPKTIEEVRRAAIQEEQDEKHKLMSLPQGPPPRGGGGGGPMGGGGGLPKKGEWSTVTSSNKSSRFAAQPKKPTAADNRGELPMFVPGGGNWGRGPGGGGSGFHNTSSSNMPPRLQQGSRYNSLANDGIPPMTPSREEIVRDLPPPRTPSSQTSSRESSRPQTPTRERENNSGYPPRAPHQSSPMPKPVNKSPPPPEEEPSSITFDVHDSVKQIFSEFASVKKLDYGWIQSRYPGKKICEFVDELSRQVCDMAREEQQKTAGGLIRSLIKQELITKAQVIESLKDGVMGELPDIEVDSPHVTTYFAMFLSELFADEEDLGWLIPLGEPIEVDYAENWTKLVMSTLSTLKLRRSEEVVQGLYRNTSGANRLPVQDSWVIGETLESIVAKMNVVLRGIPDDEESLSSILKENSWDIREELMLKGLIESICEVCWTGETGKWDLTKLNRFFKQPLFEITHQKLGPVLWRQAKEFIKRQGMAKEQEEELWHILQCCDLGPIDRVK